MKLKVKLGRESRLIDLGDRTPSTVTLGELRQEVSSQFGLEDHDFQLSLNKRDFFIEDDQNLSDFDLVSGDLLHVTGTDLPQPPEPQRQERPQPLSTYTPSSSNGSGNDSAYSSSVDDANVATGTNGSLENYTPTSDEGTCKQTKTVVSGNADSDADMQVEVNRYLQEPLMIRESTASQVPILLQQLYSSATCSNHSDALWVVVHALMIEAGFVPSDTPDIALMPESWSRPGFYLCSYTYNVTAGKSSSCSLTGVTLGASVAVHAIPRIETGFKTETVQLNSSHYVRDLCDDVPSVYRALDKLSLQIKDNICLPVINELVTAAGYRARQGLLALPWEVTLRILTYLDARSLCHLGQSCQIMKAASNDRMVWRHLYIRDFGRLADNSLDRPWHQLYQQAFAEKKRSEEIRRQQEIFFLDPMFPHGPGAGPFRPLPPRPMPFGIIGGDYDLNPEFAAGFPNPFGGRGGTPMRLPGPGRIPGGLDPFSANPLRPGRGGNLTGSPFGNPFRGPFI